MHVHLCVETFVKLIPAQFNVVTNDSHGCAYTRNNCSGCLVLQVDSVQLCHAEVTVKINLQK